MNVKALLMLPVLTAVASAQIVVPDGTKLRLRLDQTLSSATADEGQTVELSVAEAIKVRGATVVQEGSRATGTIVLAQEKRRMGRSGKLDFSVDRVRASNGEWLPVRYTLTKKQGDSKAVSTGVITAGVAVVFWPAAPFVLLRHGKDTTINKGVTFDVFIDGNHTVNSAPNQYQIARTQPANPAIVPISAQPATFTQPIAPAPTPMAVNAADQATVAITCTHPDADIEINGNFVGSAPTAVKLVPGQYSCHGSERDPGMAAEPTSDSR